MPLQRLQTPPTCHIPQLHRIVQRPRRNLRPIWRKRHTVTSLMPLQRLQTLPLVTSHSSPYCHQTPTQPSSHLEKTTHSLHNQNAPPASADTPLVTSHSFTVLSSDPDATFVPSGENDTLLKNASASQTLPPQSHPTASPSCHQTPTQPSSHLEKTTTVHIEECPSSVCRHSLVTSHSFTVLSSDPDATFVPSGENDTSSHLKNASSV